MNNSISMIVVDIDGTLLRDDQTVSEFTISTLRKCKEKGIKLVYATARGISAQKLVPIELFDGFARMGGAIAYAGDKLVYSKCISTLEARDLLNTADKAGIKIAAELNSKHYSNFKIDKVWDWLTYYEICDFNNLDIDVEKIYALPETQEEIELLKSSSPKGKRIIVTRDNFFMVMHEEAVKSKAVIAIADYWKIKKSEIAAFGDDIMDIDLLEYCDFGIAVGNALEEVKAAAKYICDTNENDGVAKWLEENVLNS